MRYLGNPVMAMPYGRNNCYNNSRRIPYPNERDMNKNCSPKSHVKVPCEEAENLRIENTVCHESSEDTKKKPLFKIMNFEICLDDLILIGLIIVLFLGRDKNSDNEDCEKDKGLFGLGDDFILIIALGYLLLDKFL